MMSLELLFLGTGTSAGIPMIGCDCATCRSTDPRDARFRPSVLIRYDDQSDSAPPGGKRQFLIDSAPEMRQQMIRHNITRLDGVMYTHAHADHIFGLDDLRRFNAVMNAPLDIYAESATVKTLRHMFGYVFDASINVNSSFVPTLIPHMIAPGESMDLCGATWTPLRLLHGRLPILGYRVDWGGHSLAYCTDVSKFPPETFPLLEDLDVLVIDSLRYRHHPTHLTVDQALQMIDQIKPRRAYLTHISHEIRHAELEPTLPEHVFLSFDGLTVSCAAARDAHDESCADR